MNKFIVLLAVVSLVTQSMQCFVIPISSLSVKKLPVRMSNDVGEHSNVNNSVRQAPLPQLDQNRRNTVAGTTASLLSIPFLQEIVSSQQLGIWATTSNYGAIAEVPGALLQGDTIVRNLWLNRLTYPALIVCLEMGLFEALRNNPLSREMLGESVTPKLQGNGRALEALIAVMTSLGLLEICDNSTIALTEPARCVLLRDSPFFWGSQLLAADGVTSALRRALYTENKKETQNYAGHSVEAINLFIDSMQAHGAVTAKASALALDSVIGKTAEYPSHHILDMAGGSGCFALALSEQYGVKVTLADLPAVVAKWRHLHKFMRNVEAVPADLFDIETWPSNGPDCHLLANVLHDWSKEQVSLILQSSYAALCKSLSFSSNPSITGKLIIIEQLLADNISGPLPAALASISMLLGDWRTGKQYSFVELEALAKHAGFSRVELGPRCGNFHSAGIAYI
jgi:hypothetical protein